VKEVLNSVRNGTPPWIVAHLEASDPVSALLRRRDQAVERALAGETIHSLLHDRSPSQSTES
jgi:membrane protein